MRKVFCAAPKHRTFPKAEPMFQDGRGVDGQEVAPRGSDQQKFELDEKGRLIVSDEQRAQFNAAGFDVQVGTGVGFFGVRKE
jgi:hypothetical protein